MPVSPPVLPPSCLYNSQAFHGVLVDIAPPPPLPAAGPSIAATTTVDPLSEPGNSDITAHVQFGPLADKARAVGFAADGPMTQAEFFGRLGMVERAARLMAASPAGASQIEGAVQRLLAPTGMGSQFKVLIVRSPRLPSPAPFA